MNPLQSQVEDLARHYSGLTSQQLPSGAVLIRLPEMPIPSGWSKSKTTIRFLAPTGYPMARPDCFWADADLRLVNGAMPASAQINQIPESGETGLWFSWHLTHAWNPNTDTLATWVGVIRARFRDAR